MAVRRPVVHAQGVHKQLPPGDTLPQEVVEGLTEALAGKVGTDDARLSDAREWTEPTVTQADAEAGTSTARRAWSVVRVWQAIYAWWFSVSSAWGRGFVASANAAAGRTALELGTAATFDAQASGVDPGAARLLRQGAWGLYSSELVADLDALIGTRFVLANSTAQGAPPVTDSYYVTQSAGPALSVRKTQIAQAMSTTRVWTRFYNGSAWQPWQEIFHSGNLVRQSSAWDLTAGAMMAQGAYGLGSAPGSTISMDWNAAADSYPRTGFVGLMNVGQANAPPSGQYFYLLQQFYTTNLVQFALPYRATFAGELPYYRTRFNGVWSPWNRFYTHSSILGTVSQSGGVPTGALIEYGSNASGEYWRYAGGMQIATRYFLDTNANSGSNDVYNSGTIAMPTTFVGWPWKKTTARFTNSAGTEQIYMSDPQESAAWSSWGFTALNVHLNAVQRVEARLIAIGRWY